MKNFLVFTAALILCTTVWSQAPQGISHSKEQTAAQKSSIMRQPETEDFNQQPLEQLLNPDGTLNLNSGFNGSFDPTGFRLLTGPNGEPRFVQESQMDFNYDISELEKTHKGDEKWETFPWAFNGVNIWVNAIAVLGGDVFVGGDFTQVGDNIIPYLAKWDGQTWHSLGDGVNGSVYALAVSGGDLYAGGAFGMAGGEIVNRIAMWDGTDWHALGSGVNGIVYAITISDNDVYAGGTFFQAGGQVVNSIAKWDGESWEAIGNGVNGFVMTIALSGSDIYVGGGFTQAGGVDANNIAKWDGESWEALNSGVNNTVRAIAISGNDVYAGGWFTQAGGLTTNYIARWDGMVWSALDGGMNDVVESIALAGSEVYVGGRFTMAGDVGVNHIAKWNGTSWSSLGDGFNGFPQAAVGLMAITISGTDLYAGGWFNEVGGISADNIAKWDGVNWHAFDTGVSGGNGVNGRVFSLAISGSEVYVGGSFYRAGDKIARGIAKWDGASWSALGSGVNYTVLAITVSGSDVYAGGVFTEAGGMEANYIAKWDGTSWSPLGEGLNNAVYAINVFDNEIYVGGFFTQAGGIDANYIAKWNGGSWSALGEGLNNGVFTITSSETEIFVGGLFTQAGGIGANRVARWDGSSWHALGSGVNSSVYALALSGNDLYVGGNFTVAGGLSANRIARWDGDYWWPLENGMNSTVWDIAVSDNYLYACGSFTHAGLDPANRIARWDGGMWMPLGSGVNEVVRAISISSYNVYLGGTFTQAGGKNSNGLALWSELNLPSIFSAIVISPYANAEITVQAYVHEGTFPISTVTLYYTIDGGGEEQYEAVTEEGSGTWVASFGQYPEGTEIVWRLEAVDEENNLALWPYDGSWLSFKVSQPGPIVAWGSNDNGQCDVPVPNKDFVSAEGGRFHSVGLKSDGTIVAWGSNDYGQCDSPEPNSDFSAVAGGGFHNLGLRSDGGIVAWGRNNYGQCDVPESNYDFVAVAGGNFHSLGLKSDGTILAWGWNHYGQCNVPESNEDFIAVAGAGWHSLGLKSDGTIVAWGRDDEGQCDVPEPNGDFVAVAGGMIHSLGLKTDGTIVAWGNNDQGQCDVPEPNGDFVAVAAGMLHSLGLKSDGTIVAWGRNEEGQCNVPEPNFDFLAVAGAGLHSLALKRPQILSVTFNINMSHADDFNPGSDQVYVTGTFIDSWPIPGADPDNQLMTRVDETMIWTKTLSLEEGEYEYKYFINDGWEGGEWSGLPNRQLTISADTVLHDMWNHFSVHVAAQPEEGGSATGDGIYRFGMEASVHAWPEEGYIFLFWTKGEEIVSTQQAYNFFMPAEDITLTAHFEPDDDYCPPPGWVPVTNMQYNMQVTAHLYMYDGISYNPDDILGAFVDGECRGIASPDPDQNGLVFLTISSNVPSGETVELVIWDSENCEPCNYRQTIDFENLQQVGTPAKPYGVDCQSVVELTIPMGDGFTWFSINVDPGSMNVNDLLESLEPCPDDRVIGQTSYATFFNDQWIGTLITLDPSRGYKMHLCSTQELNLIGTPVASPILDLGAGFTWLGYTPQDCLVLNEALEAILPEPVENDRIIGQTSYATYYDGGWIGSLTHLCPGTGYVIDLSSSSTLQYPDAGQKDLLAQRTASLTDDPFRNSIVPNLQHTMTLVGQLTDMEGLVSLNQNDAVFAIINEEIRGMARPSPAHDGLLFMNIGSNADAGDLIRFSAWSDDLKEFVGINETLAFQSLQHAGTIASPFVFTMSGAVGTDVFTAGSWTIGDPYPNPTHGTVSFPYYIGEPARVELLLYSSTGHLVHSQQLRQELPGHHKLELKKGALPRGVYFYKLLLSGTRNSILKTGALVVID